jgi:hypothetical protein
LPNYGSEVETTAAKQSDLSELEVREDLDDMLLDEEVDVSSSSNENAVEDLLTDNF